MEKMTYVKALQNAIAEVSDVETKEKLTALCESLVNKAKNKKPTETQKANKVLKVAVLETMATMSGTCGEIAKANPQTENLSTPKMSALLKALVAEGKVVRSTEGKKTIFALAE